MRAAAVAAGGKKKGFVLSLVVDVLLRLTINQPTHTQRRESFCCCCLVEELNTIWSCGEERQRTKAPCLLLLLLLISLLFTLAAGVSVLFDYRQQPRQQQFIDSWMSPFTTGPVLAWPEDVNAINNYNFLPNPPITFLVFPKFKFLHGVNLSSCECSFKVTNIRGGKMRFILSRTSNWFSLLCVNLFFFPQLEQNGIFSE